VRRGPGGLRVPPAQDQATAAGAPPAPTRTDRAEAARRSPPSSRPKRDAAMGKVAQWRASTPAGTWKAVRKKFNDAGVEVALLCYNMQDSMKDEDIEYGFAMARVWA
jgi:hypothetical protein